MTDVDVNLTSNGLTASADVVSNGQCDDNAKIENSDFSLTLTKDKITLNNLSASPAATLGITVIGVATPQLTGYNTTFTQVAKGQYQIDLPLGALRAGKTVEIPITYTVTDTNPCLGATFSSDGIAASYPQPASISLQ